MAFSEEHLKAIIHKINKRLNLEQTDVLQLNDLNQKRENCMSSIKRIVLKDEERQNKFIIKIATTDTAIREIDPVQETFRTEFLMYNRVFPKFAELQNTFLNEVLWKSFPTYITGSDEINKEFFVFEDLSAQNFIMCDKKSTLDFNHCKIVLAELGKFHALSFVVKQRDPLFWKNITSNLEDTFHKKLFSNDEFLEHLKINCQEVSQHINDDIIKHSFVNFTRNLKANILELVSSQTSGSFAVITHGDLWIPNILFSYKENSLIPNDVRFVDWQLSRLASPALDLTFFFSVNTNKHLREQNYEILLKQYYRSFSYALEAFKLNADLIFSWEILITHMKKFSPFGALKAIQLIYLLLDGDALKKEYVERCADVVFHAYKNIV